MAPQEVVEVAAGSGLLLIPSDSQQLAWQIGPVTLLIYAAIELDTGCQPAPDNGSFTHCASGHLGDCSFLTWTANLGRKCRWNGGWFTRVTASSGCSHSRNWRCPNKMRWRDKIKSQGDPDKKHPLIDSCHLSDLCDVDQTWFWERSVTHNGVPPEWRLVKAAIRSFSVGIRVRIHSRRFLSKRHSSPATQFVS